MSGCNPANPNARRLWRLSVDAMHSCDCSYFALPAHPSLFAALSDALHASSVHASNHSLTLLPISSRTHPLTYSLTYSLVPSLTHIHIHTHSLSHSLTPSLTRSLPLFHPSLPLSSVTTVCPSVRWLSDLHDEAGRHVRGSDLQRPVGSALSETRRGTVRLAGARVRAAEWAHGLVLVCVCAWPSEWVCEWESMMSSSIVVQYLPDGK